MWLSCIPETNVSRTILTVIVALFLIIQLIVANVINAGFRLLLIYSGHVCRAPDRECTLLFLQENICEYWLGAPLRDVYNTYPQNKFSLKNGKLVSAVSVLTGFFIRGILVPYPMFQENGFWHLRYIVFYTKMSNSFFLEKLKQNK